MRLTLFRCDLSAFRATWRSSRARCVLFPTAVRPSLRVCSFPCEDARILRPPPRLCKTFYSDSVRSNFPIATPTSLPTLHTRLPATRTSFPASPTCLRAAPVPFLQVLRGFLQGVFPFLQAILPSLQRLLRPNTPRNKAITPRNDPTTPQHKPKTPHKSPTRG